jgi:hypothetical protein
VLETIIKKTKMDTKTKVLSRIFLMQMLNIAFLALVKEPKVVKLS